jgi:hypothetical protein
VLLRIVVEAEAQDPQAAKENLAMALERYAPARVVEVAPVYRQERMGPGAMVNGDRRHTPSVTAAPCQLPLGGSQGRCAARNMGSLEEIPTEGVVGPFARADAALRAAMEGME